MEEPAEPIPWLRNKDLAYYGPFRDNVKAFIKNETEADDFYVEGGILGHTVTLAKGTKYEASMRVYEETMLDSSRVHCDCCRCIGWHHHPVTRKQYHFIIHTDFRADLKPELKGKRICQICTAAMPAKDKVCASCGENDGETSILDYQTHLMHGMLHANGCGHLMRINGREAGSRVLSGQQLIQIWEKVCNLLRAREVSVEDVSQKYGVEFRLLNPVACGKTWYGTFGYQFGKGSFGNTAATHRKAAELLRNFPLADVVHDFKNMRPTRANSSNNLLELKAETESPGGSLHSGDDETLEVIARYEVLMGRHAPRTLGGLVALLLRLQRIVRRNDKAEKELLLRSQRESKERGEGGDEGADAKARRREEEREAAAKRKAGTSEALFEPLAFQHHSKRPKRVGYKRGDDGVNGVEPPTSPQQRRVMSSAKPRALPSRPLRPRGADGLVPATESPFKAEPAPNPRHLAASIRPQVKRELDLDPTQPKKLASREGKKQAKPSTSAPGSTKMGFSKAFPGFDVEVNTSRWSDARIETASNHCVEVLREHGGKYMPRQEVRALARAKGVGDTGLLDHVLKNISERRVILTKTAPKAEKGATQRASIKRRQNASTGQLEYMLESVPGMSKMVASVVISAGASGGKKTSSPAPPSKKSGADKVLIKSEPAQQQQQQRRTTHVKPETVKRPGLTGEQNAMEEAARQLTRDDLDRDIKLVYKSVLEHYKPARPRPGRPPSKDGKGAKSKVRGADLVAAARVLLDTKQFVKTYVPVESLLTLRPPPPRGPDGQGKGGRPPMLAKGLRVLVTAVIDAKNKGPKVSGMDVSAKGGRRKHGVETKPPPEVVLLPPDPLLSDLKLAVNKCFQDLYVVLAKFKVSYAVGFESTKDATKLGAKKIGGARVEVHGDGADLESEFRYQGGLDQWVVRCVCGTCDDDGERMICCDACEVWMHTRCVSIADSQGTPRKWTCADCEDKGKVSNGGGGNGGNGVSHGGSALVASAAARERPPPTLRRPLPERILKRRKATRR